MQIVCFCFCFFDESDFDDFEGSLLDYLKRGVPRRTPGGAQSPGSTPRVPQGIFGVSAGTPRYTRAPGLPGYQGGLGGPGRSWGPREAVR